MRGLVIKAGWHRAKERVPSLADFRLECSISAAALFEDYADAVEAAHGFGEQLKAPYAPGRLQIDIEERESYGLRDDGPRWRAGYRIISDRDRERSYHIAYLAAADASGEGRIRIGQYVAEADIAIREASAMLSRGLGAGCPGLNAALAQARGAVLGVLEQLNEEEELGSASSEALLLACGSVTSAVRIAEEAENAPLPALAAALRRAEAAMETVRGQYNDQSPSGKPSTFQLLNFRQRKPGDGEQDK